MPMINICLSQFNHYTLSHKRRGIDGCTHQTRPDMKWLLYLVLEAHEYTHFWSTLSSGYQPITRSSQVGPRNKAFPLLPSVHLCLFCISLCLHLTPSLFALLPLFSFFQALSFLAVIVVPFLPIYFILSICLCVSLLSYVCLISQWAVCHTLTLTFSRAPA